MHAKVIETIEGHPIVHNRMVPAMPLVSPRSIISCLYRFDVGEESVMIGSARGNEDLVEKHKALIGEDVVADLEINMVKFSPKYDASGEEVGTNIV